ncbi:MAG TPA: P-loop NTPase, partial [Cyclobacteriaceae bacterium]|nr:P-loop NTPase [Cyclobacteriaceae bacterium]
YYIFGKDGGKNLADKFSVPLLGQVPLVQSIRESGDSGLPAVMKEGVMANIFKTIAENVARQVAIRNATFAETKRVELTV